MLGSSLYALLTSSALGGLMIKAARDNKNQPETESLIQAGKNLGALTALTSQTDMILLLRSLPLVSSSCFFYSLGVILVFL